MGEPQISHTVITEIAVALKMLSCWIIQPTCTITSLSSEIINVLITATIYLAIEVDSAWYKYKNDTSFIIINLMYIELLCFSLYVVTQWRWPVKNQGETCSCLNFDNTVICPKNNCLMVLTTSLQYFSSVTVPPLLNLSLVASHKQSLSYCLWHIYRHKKVKVKVKWSRYRPGVA